MASIWGRNIKISVFGESYSKAIGVTIDGLPAGVKIDFDQIYFNLKKRSPGRNSISSGRRELDIPEILCGIKDNTTTGSPLTAVFYNNDLRQKDYDSINYLPRPSHADFTAYKKYKGFNDYRGGGHFSGRLTCPITFAGSIALQILQHKNIKVSAHIKSIFNIFDDEFDPCNISQEIINKLRGSDFPLICPKIKNEMAEVIERAKADNDSVGGTVECAVIGLPCGVGEPMFNSIESTISSIMFSIPAIIGVEFGLGFKSSLLYGSKNNDQFYCEDGIVRTKTNNSGGINGGISNSMPVIFRVAVKPTPSIGRKQDTINISTGQNEVIEIIGRHDPCIVPRVVPVVESACSLAILDLLIEGGFMLNVGGK
jgi:chorismate synthase